MTTFTNFDPILKDLYGPQKVESITYMRRPLFSRVAKYENAGGRRMPLPFKFGNPQGRSASFSTAQTNVTAPQYESFDVTYVNDHSVATVTGEVIDATKNDKQAFLQALTASIDAAMESLSDALETFLYRTGSGSIGRISSGSTVASGTITLEEINDITNFEVGMTVVAAATETGAIRTGTEVVAAVDRTTGDLDSMSTNWDDVITAIAASDFLFVQGDAQNAGSALKITGLHGWLADTPGTLFGVDTTVDTRLSGQRHTGTSQTVEEALVDGQSKGAREGGNIDWCFMNHIQVRTLKKEMQSRIEYQYFPAQTAKGDSLAKVSFRALMVEGDHGPIEVYAANKCQAGFAWLLESRTWKLVSMGPAVRFNMPDNIRVLRQSAADGVEARMVFRGQMTCNAPGYNCRVSLTVPS